MKGDAMKGPLFAAFLLTLAVGSSHAVEIPHMPLQTGAAYPPANVMFILDDSGSMVFEAMPDDDATMDDIVDDKAYVNNTIYYNPAVTYLPWMTAGGTRMTGGTAWSAAYADLSLASGDTIDLGDDDSCERVDRNGSGRWVCGGVQTFFVPKAGATDYDDEASFYRYQIRDVSGDGLNTQRVVRSEWVKVTNGNEGVQGAGCGANWWDNRSWRNCTLATPTGRSEAAEMQNFATWFSYYRTRIKAAKAGASEAFGQLGDSIRVGYDSIWNRDSKAASYFTGSVSSTAGPAYPIPVGDNDGLFSGTNRSDWFAQLQGAHGYNGTPLKGALQRSGRYFESTATTGPWGPGSDPLSCRQSFAILTTDGYWNDNSGYVSVGDADATNGDEIVSEDGKSTFQYKPVTPYRDDFERWRGGLYSKGDTLADVANYYWKRDLVDALANDVPTSTADPAFWQHMVTFGVSIGLRGRLDPKTDLQSITNGSKHWGDPTDAEDLDRIDDLWHAAVNGHGNFVTATNPAEFVQGLIDALATVAQRLGSASNVTANSTSFQTDTRVYQASYVSGKWTGELAAYEVSSAGVSSKDEDGDGVPDAAWKASGHIPAFGKRNILTSSATGAAKGAAFPTAAQVAALDVSDRAAVNGGPATGAQNAAYIAGSQALETRQGGNLRDRDTLLGDIANSSPMYVDETEAIFVGANDGMLHAFAAEKRRPPSKVVGGQELFAYVPAGIDLDALATLSDPQYSRSHRYFVDGPVVVSTRAQSGGRIYLVGSLGRGGKGVYALDVTDPDKFDAGDVLWDYTGDALGSNMGQVLGEPVIASLKDGTQVIITGNGINSASGRAVLFVIDLDTGAVLAELDTGAGGDNGLSAPRAADLDADGFVDVVYAGDLAGHVWKFDLDSASSADWAVANGGLPLFTATDPDGTAQPITAGLGIAREPVTGRIWVFIGTGSFMSTQDVQEPMRSNVQSLYGIIDAGAPVSRSALLQRRIVVAGYAPDGSVIRGFEAASDLAAGKQGWYLDLVQPPSATPQGERVVSNPRVRGTVLLVASLIPPTSGTCDAGGSGFVNALDAFTGASLGNPYFDVNGDGEYDADDEIAIGDDSVPVGSVDLGVGMPTLPTTIDDLLVVGGSSGSLGSVSTNPQGGAAKRVSWREILRD
jgi:type IV pilus assembly protein PilY1